MHSAQTAVSRANKIVDYWPAFQPWWTSREQIFGPHKEVTRLVWYHVNAESGVQHVPHIWAGVFVLLVARFLFPTIHIALVDTDSVPVSLFEIEDLILLSKLQMNATAPVLLPEKSLQCTSPRLV